MIIARHNDDDQVIYIAGRWLVVVDYGYDERPRVEATSDNERAADLTAGMREELVETANRIMGGRLVFTRDFDRLGEHIDDCQEPACCGGRDRYCPCTPRGLGREL